MTFFTSSKTEKGNISTSFISQEDADKKASIMDENYCYNCTDCYNCTYCTNCTDCYNCTNCYDCTKCYDCTNCTNLTYCYNCTYCTNCYDCYDCINCTNLTNCYNCIQWTGNSALRVTSLTGMKYNIATDGKQLQIGCTNMYYEEWKALSDSDIVQKFGSKALKFKYEYEVLIAVFVETVRKNREAV